MHMMVSIFSRFTTNFATLAMLLVLSIAAPAQATSLGLTEIEKAFIKEHPTIRVANEMNWAPFNFNSNGVPRGYVIDYMTLVAEKAGLKIEYISGPTYEEFISMFRTGTLDVIPNITFNQPRSKFTQFTEKYVSLDNALVSRKVKDKPTEISFESLAGQRLAIVKGDDYARIIKRRFPKVLIFEQTDALGCLKAVAEGQAVAAFGAKATYSFLAGMHFISDLEYTPITEVPLIKTSKIHIGVRHDWPILREILQKGMNAVDYGEIRALHKKWLDQADLYSGGASEVLLTQKEQLYLRDKQMLTMVVDPDWPPFESINNSLQHTGMAADYMALLSERIGVPIKLVPTETWRESLKKAKAGECDIVSMLNETPDRDKYLDFTAPYFSSPLVIVARKKVGLINGLADMKNKIVAVPAGYWVEETIRREHSNIHILTAKNTEDTLRMVQEGEAFATVATLIEASHLIQKKGFTNLKIVGNTKYENKLRVGVRKGDATLLAIMEKGVNSFGDKEKSDIFAKWMTVRLEHGFDYTLLWKILGGVAVILLVFLYWNRKLSRLNKEIAETHQKVSLLLDNSGQGFLSFGQDLIIDPEFSQECTIIFGDGMACVSIAGLLYPDDVIGSGNFDKNIKRIMTATDEFKRDLYLGLMQKEFRLGEMVLEAEYKLIGPERMMLILTDITRQKALEDEIKVERNKLKFVVSAVRESRDFFDILDEYKSFHSNQLPGLLANGADPKAALNEIYRQVHTFKGLFSQQDFLLVPGALHDVESGLDKLKYDEDLTIDSIKALLASGNCDTMLESDLDIIKEVLGDDFMRRHGEVAITQEQAEGLKTLADNLLSKALGDMDNETKKLLDEVRNIQLTDLRELLAAYPRAAIRLAENLEKEIKSFEIEGGDVRVDPDKYAPFTKALVHVFRNAVDHGIEDPIEREESGKDEEANLSCIVGRNASEILIEITDDGRGLDPARLGELAVERKIMSEAEVSSASKQDIYRVIFADSFSTNEEVNELSGRGIGLAAVLSELEKLGGKVDIESEPGKGTAFRFAIPAKDA